MPSFVITKNNKSTEYKSFKSAFNSFIKPISKLNHLPEAVDRFFAYLIRSREITDKDIIVYYRSLWIMESLGWEDSKQIERAVRLLIHQDIHYERTIDSLCEKIKIDIIKVGEEIRLDIVHIGASETYVHTNAFAFMNKRMHYYFNYHEIVDTVLKEDKTKLGKSYNLDITLN